MFAKHFVAYVVRRLKVDLREAVLVPLALEEGLVVVRVRRERVYADEVAAPHELLVDVH